MNRRELGRAGETLAEELLRSLGYDVLEKNYRCRLGEIDLIARDGASLVFVEVKTRRSKAFGEASEAITRDKKVRLARLARFFLVERNLGEVLCRFDVVVVNWPIAIGGKPVCELIQNAF